MIEEVSSGRCDLFNLARFKGAAPRTQGAKNGEKANKRRREEGKMVLVLGSVFHFLFIISSRSASLPKIV